MRGPIVMFWVNVVAVYAAVVAVGVVLGHYLAARRGKGGGGRHRLTGPTPTLPSTPSPSFGLDLPPLGSDFDRALLPGVSFADAPVRTPA